MVYCGCQLCPLLVCHTVYIMHMHLVPSQNHVQLHSTPSHSVILHTQDYVAHYREWDTPSPPVKILCPIDHSIDNKEHSGSEDSQSKNEEGQSGAEEQAGHVFNGWRRSRARPSGVRRPNAPYAQPMNVNGRRMLICNVNGVYFQV